MTRKNVSLVVVFLLTIAIFLGYMKLKVAKFQTQLVLDCIEEECVEREISYNVINCKEYWFPEDEESEPHCDQTKEGLESIGMIADEENYVPVLFTSEKYEANLVPIMLTEPRDIKIFSDGKLLIAEQAGAVVIADNNGSSRQVVYQVQFEDPDVADETGLRGIAIDPDFEDNNKIYIYYSYKYDKKHPSFTDYEHEGERRVVSRLSEVVLGPQSKVEESILLDDIPSTVWHTGGGLDFGPDGKLYLSTGEAEERELSQDPQFLGGKVLRLNTDGSIPTDNPYENSYAFSLGHRNPQGITWINDTNTLITSEHGDWRYDEINVIKPGGNYGWGTYKCGDKLDYLYSEPLTQEVLFPIVCAKSWTLAPSGIAYVNDKNSPWYGNLFVAGLRSKHLHRYVINNGEITSDDIFFASGKNLSQAMQKRMSQRIRDVVYHQESLYVLGDGYGLVKINPILAE